MLTQKSTELLDEVELRIQITRLMYIIFKNNADHGFWEGNIEDFNKGEKLMLIVTELAEVLEALRHGNPPDEKVPEFSSEAVEIADAVIRILDYCAAYNIDLVGAILAKHAYNVTRPFKHGKKF